jgi:UTP--glucose-1-phosphate uridylyltransferase
VTASPASSAPSPALRPVRKAVIPAAGLGTRFLPATKAMPKELLPLVDKPGIQWVVEEAVRSGITDILIVTGRSKKAVEDHFDYAPELEASLERSGKSEQAAQVRALAEMADIHFIRQGNPKGLGHAVGMARAHVGDEPFAVLLPDDLMAEDSTLLADMIAVTNRSGSSCISLKRFGPDEISMYGCVAGREVEPNLMAIHDMVEKPKAAEAPSDLAIMGRYVLTAEIFDRIDSLVPGAGGELQLTDAMRELCKAQDFYGLVFDTGRYDTGNKLDWLRATIEVALGHPEVGRQFRDVLTEIVRREGL